jgi:transcriptional regulator with XRE-family HTH domain
MDRPGEKLRRVRERLKLTYREVAEASRKIAERRGSREFALAISRLADIENQNKVPSVYRLYTLSAIYGLDLGEILRWYGVPSDQLAGDSLHVGLAQTHPLEFTHAANLSIPQMSSGVFDPGSTAYVSQLIQHWGKMPFTYLNGVETREFRYGWIGVDDWSMYPVLHPGSVVAIDDTRRRIARAGWTSEYDRPIYFFELRTGFRCGWCTLDGARLIIEPHPASSQQAAVFEWPREIEVIGQVVGAAMMLRHRKRQPRASLAVLARAAHTP